MKRRESLKVQDRNASVVEAIKHLKMDHPFWGYRRIWAHLKYVDGLEVNKKRILRPDAEARSGGEGWGEVEGQAHPADFEATS